MLGNFRTFVLNIKIMFCHVVLKYLYKLLTGLFYGMVTGKVFFSDMRKKIEKGIWKSLENREKEVD